MRTETITDTTLTIVNPHDDERILTAREFIAGAKRTVKRFPRVHRTGMLVALIVKFEGMAHREAVARQAR